MPEDLEDMIRRRQDELRGRPETWADRLRDRWQLVDLEGAIVTGLVMMAALALLVASLLSIAVMRGWIE